ncbi:MAG: DUF859 domain-containing protein [Solobacterium sp.]|jgi:hypothetical protein|nr:DUF859 domain-containing protein [Solobacterium sp.]
MATLTSDWQEIARTSQNTGYGNQYVIFYARTTEDTASNTSTVHTLIRTTVEGSGNVVNVSSWSCASDTDSASGGWTSWGEGDHNLLESVWTVSHNDDGSGSVSIGMQFNATFNITDWGYRTTVGLQTIPRYASVSQSLASKTETSIQMKFAASAECDGVWYSLNGGSWQGTGVVPHTGGYYTITGLSANTAYTVKTRLKRTDSQLYSETGAISVTTYDWPHATGCPAFIIGNSVMDTIYNPLSRYCTVIMYNTNWGEVKRTTTSNTSAYFSSSDFSDALYASIPNADHGNYVCRVVYGSSSRDDYGTYYVNGNVCYPSVSGFAYVDSNSKTIAITGDSSKIVQNLSTPSYAMTAAARYHASLSSAWLKVNGKTYTCAISGNKITVQGGVINSGNDVNAICQVTDSRGIAAGMSVKLTMLAWSNPTAINTIHRHNNFYSETDITCDSSFSQIGSNALAIQYTATSQKGTVISGSLSDNVMITKTLDNEQSWTIAIVLTDSFGGKTTYSIPLQRGQPILFIDGPLESISVGMFPTIKRSIQSAGAVTAAKKAVTVNASSWSSSTTTVNGTAYYYYNIALTAAYDEHPTITLIPAGTLPTTAESNAYNCMDQANTSGTTLTLYAKIKPTSNFSINIEGVA